MYILSNHASPERFFRETKEQQSLQHDCYEQALKSNNVKISFETIQHFFNETVGYNTFADAFQDSVKRKGMPVVAFECPDEAINVAKKHLLSLKKRI